MKAIRNTKDRDVIQHNVLQQVLPSFFNIEMKIVQYIMKVLM